MIKRLQFKKLGDTREYLIKILLNNMYGYHTEKTFNFYTIYKP